MVLVKFGAQLDIPADVRELAVCGSIYEGGHTWNIHVFK